MIATRTEARALRTRTVFALVAGLAVLAGCSRAPKPRAEVPTDTTRTTANRPNTGTARRPAPAPPPAPAPEPKPVPDPAAGVSSGSSTSQPAVVPQLPAAEQERLERETKSAMEAAQKALDGIEVAKLDAERNRKYVIARDFLTQAGDARTRREFERAQSLAQKARLLAEEIAPR
jgi:HAMP domain-containing protein